MINLSSCVVRLSSRRSLASCILYHYALPQHFLYFFPLPQKQGSFLPIFLSRLIGAFLSSPSPLLKTIRCCSSLLLLSSRSISTSLTGFTLNNFSQASSLKRFIIAENISYPSFLYSYRGKDTICFQR